MSAALELRGLRAGYGRLAVLHDVDLAVPSGGALAVVGPNGAGKTTLLAVAAGLLAPTAGRVLLDGRDVTGLPPSQRVEAGLCLIPEGRGIFPALSVRDNLRVAAGGESWDAAVELFEVLGSRLDQRAGTLSGGEQQMLAMSRALLRTPRVLLLDELSLGLAPRIVDQLYEAVAAMHQAGSAVVLVEQYVDKALELCDLVAILEGGRIRFAGEPSELDEAGASIGNSIGGRR